jgi:hypothetical protein
LFVSMERHIDGLEYRETFRVHGPSGPIDLELRGADWVDWDRRGRLVVLRAGVVAVADVSADAIAPLRELIDLAADEPEQREAPTAAQSW